MPGADKPEWPPLLPLGFHNFDAVARYRMCVERFPSSITRPRISANLEAIIAAINHQSIAGDVWIDGSYLTEKLNPDDVDLALVITRDTHSKLNSVQQQFFHNLNDKQLYEQYRLDSYGIAIDVGTYDGEYTYAYWLKQFGFSRADQPKGIIRVAVPYVVVP
jgi:hypothetical protein